MKVQHVSIEYVHQVWPLVEPLIKSGVERRERPGDYSLEEMRTLVAMGHWMMVVAAEDDDKIVGVALVNFINRHSSRVAFVTFASGRGIANTSTFGMFANVLKAFGATTLEAAVVGSRERLWRRVGLVEKYRIVETKL